MWLFCVRASAWKRVVEIAETEVSVTPTSTAGREAWQGSLAAYRGVAPLDVLVRNEGRERQIAAVVLDHEDPNRRIVLWSMLVSGGRREACQEYADWLGMDVVEPLATQGQDKTIRRA
tara:strand:+ start:733 stop:1086 length:354 start_codon:yes stop_codon:yes gene_type:complete